MRAGLNLSLAGFSWWGADVFGLDGKTTPEMHARYAQWALFIPIARYFWRPTRVDDTRLPWSHGSQAEAVFRKYVELRYRLLPYLYTLAWQAHQSGIPILRPLVLEFPDDPRLAEVDDQFMLGEQLMICPIVSPRAMARRILLPEGVWHDFWTEKPLTLSSLFRVCDYPAPLDCLPMLARGGTILPLGPVFQHIADDHRFDELQLHLWPPLPSEFTLYEDDGCTTAYQRGDYSLTRIVAEGNHRQVTVQLSPAGGSFAGQPETRRVELIFHQLPYPLTKVIHCRMDVENIIEIEV